MPTKKTKQMFEDLIVKIAMGDFKNTSDEERSSLVREIQKDLRALYKEATKPTMEDIARKNAGKIDTSGVDIPASVSVPFEEGMALLDTLAQADAASQDIAFDIGASVGKTLLAIAPLLLV
jgi:hypothetical protein